MPILFKGFHYAWPLTLRIGCKTKDIVKTVTFEESCRYKIDGPDMYDINKLFGIGYFWGHHTDSARFGWRYDPSVDTIEIFAYAYVNGERVERWLCDVKFGEKNLFGISVQKNNYFFWVISSNSGSVMVTETINKDHKKKWSYGLGLYFGGNKTSPKRMKIKFEQP